MQSESRGKRQVTHAGPEAGAPPSGAEIHAVIAKAELISEGGELFDVCEAWFQAWSSILAYARSNGLHSLKAVAKAAPGEEAILDCRWQFQDAVWYAGMLDPSFWQRSLTYLEQYLEQFTSDSRIAIEGTRYALGATHAALGQHDRANELFRGWLEADPAWGWGWIAWCECYLLTDDHQDEERAEDLLRQGLAVPGIRDEPELHRRLRVLYDAMGRDADAAQARADEQDALRRESARRG